MLTLVNSNEKELSFPEIITLSLKSQLDGMNINLTQALGTVTAEMALKNAKTIQVGNTVFLTHYGKTPETEKKTVGRAFNADTGKNFINNGFRFFAALQRQGVTHYSTEFKGNVFLNAFKIFQRRAAKQDTEIFIGRTEDDRYRVFIRFGKERLVLGKNK